MFSATFNSMQNPNWYFFVQHTPHSIFLSCFFLFCSSIDALALVDPIAVNIDGIGEGVNGCAKLLLANAARGLADLGFAVHAALNAIVVVAEGAAEHRRQFLRFSLGHWLGCTLALPHLPLPLFQTQKVENNYANKVTAKFKSCSFLGMKFNS